MKERIIGVIGMGWVGSSVAISLLHTGVVDKLLLSDINADLAEGEAMDMSHGSSFYPQAKVIGADIDDMIDCDIVIIAAGKGGKPEQSRLDLLKENAAITTNIARKFSDFKGTIVMVTNPVDILTQVFMEASGLPKEKVLGTGTMLDTSRLRDAIGHEIDIDPKSIHAQVIGEHGDSEVVLWSEARVGSKKLRDWSNWSEDKESIIAEKVKKAAYEIIQRKGATNHAIGLVTAHLVKWMLRDERRIICVSRYQPDYDITLSLPSVVGIEGATRIIVPEMSQSEKEGFENSVDVLKKAYESLKR